MQKIFDSIIAIVVERKKQLTTVEFAKLIDMPQQTVDLYLKGQRKPSVEFVFKFCSTFGVSADKLLGLPTSENHHESMSSIPVRFASRLDEVKRNAEQATASINALQNAIEKLNKTI